MLIAKGELAKQSCTARCQQQGAKWDWAKPQEIAFSERATTQGIMGPVAWWGSGLPLGAVLTPLSRDLGLNLTVFNLARSFFSTLQKNTDRHDEHSGREETSGHHSSRVGFQTGHGQGRHTHPLPNSLSVSVPQQSWMAVEPNSLRGHRGHFQSEGRTQMKINWRRKSYCPSLETHRVILRYKKKKKAAICGTTFSKFTLLASNKILASGISAISL